MLALLFCLGLVFQAIYIYAMRREKKNSTSMLKTKSKYLWAYRAPWICAPVRVRRARVSIALLSVGRFVKNFTAQIVKALPVGPLTCDQPCFYPAATGLRTLWTRGGTQNARVSTCSYGTGSDLFTVGATQDTTLPALTLIHTYIHTHTHMHTHTHTQMNTIPQHSEINSVIYELP